MEKLTRAVVDAATYPYDPRSNRRHVVWDGELKGYGLRVYPSGVKRWVYRYVLHGRQRWYVIGRYPGMTPEEARKRAKKASVAVDDGNDPATERRKARQRSMTVAELADEWMADHEPPTVKATTAGSYRSILKVHVKPVLGRLPVAAVTEEDVKRLHGKLKPYIGNRVLWVVRDLMKLAERRGLRPRNSDPTEDVKRAKERARKRFLTPSELGKVGVALRELEAEGRIPKLEAAALRLLMLTGCRLREVLGLRWQNIDRERGLVHLDDAKAGERSFPLTAPVLEVLGKLDRDDDLVFPHPRKPGRPIHDLRYWWVPTVERAGIEWARLHDLRHSVGAWSASSGDSMLLVGAILGHKSAGSTARYAHLGDDPVREAAERVAAGIAAALDGEAGDDGGAEVATHPRAVR
ncbi:MAG TPA: site-specific integrase [Thermoanaerobaculia bacterium]|nr:site-specific integrase [Thermoanaerobaculia bacterium]